MFAVAAKQASKARNIFGFLLVFQLNGIDAINKITKPRII
jgi:hypothetical protein